MGGAVGEQAWSGAIRMDVTAKLLRVFLVEKQLRGLRSRLTGAESFLRDQESALSKVDARRQEAEASLKQARVRAADQEGEVKRLDTRLEAIRAQMNSAQTNKEYKAFLTEVNTLKAERDRLETVALEYLAKADELGKQIEALQGERGERERVRGVASSEREDRHREIKDRLAELTAERAALSKDVPGEAMAVFEKLLSQRGEEAMAPVEVHDLKRGEMNCGSCMMSLPLDTVSGLVSKGKLTRCSSCQCILYLEDATRDSMMASVEKKVGGKR